MVDWKDASKDKPPLGAVVIGMSARGQAVGLAYRVPGKSSPLGNWRWAAGDVLPTIWYWAEFNWPEGIDER